MQRVTFTTSGPLGKSSLREANERVVLLALLRQPGLSRLEVAKATGLSPSAITGIIDRLMNQGFLSESKRDQTLSVGAGRPRAPLQIRAEARYAIGVEIAAAEATAALADLSGKVIAERSVPVNGEPAEKFLRRIHAAVRELAEQGGERTLGVAVSIPGNLDPATGRVRQATNLDWHDLHAIDILKGDLALPFYWENNANLAALAERWFHGGSTLDHFVFVTLRVGIGTGVMVNGQLMRGANNCAGEFGHVTLVPGGRGCVCGQQGCWEEYASDRALVRLYREYGGDARFDSLGVVEQARQNDARARRALDETAEALAVGLCPLILGLNPAAIALDDWAAAGWDLIEGLVWHKIEHRVPAAWRQGVKIFPSSYAMHSSLTGAIALVLAQFFTSFEPEHGDQGGPVRMSV